MTILGLLVMLIVIGLVLYVVSSLPLDPGIRRIIQALVAVLVVFWLMDLAFGWLPLPFVRVR